MIQNIDRQVLAKKAHAAAVAKGFWDEKHSQEHYLMFVVMDLSGAVEAHQVSHRADYAAHKRALIDPESTEGIIARSMGEDLINEIAFEEHIAYTLEDKLADAYIRLLDFAEEFGYDVSPDDFFLENREHIASLVKSVSFPDNIFRIAAGIGKEHFEDNTAQGCSFVLSALELLAEFEDIDLLWHIEEKMRYNETKQTQEAIR
ncbi:MAG: hypothetical protein Q4A64_08815 [Porphyromonadaceae bacterium]|nr:hypothetical protein [Porphyromonadaceae bacterium]